jgi:hypothetical protein
MSGNVRSGVRLTPAQMKVIEYRCSGMTWTDAARAASVADRTTRRWRSEPAFVAAPREAQSSTFTEGLGLIQANVGRAAVVIAEILDDREADRAVRLRAAQVVIESGIKATETIDVRRRLEALERGLATRSRGAAG